MELIQIGENAIKVMLTREDMEYYDIVFDTLDYKNAGTRRAIGRILAEAKRKVGFSAESESLYIQAFSDGEGGCELFVRRSEEKRSMLYAFDELEPMLKGCARLRNCGFDGESSAYREVYGGRYFLLLEGERAEKYIFLSELARVLPHKGGFLDEHAEKICDNAVETLGVLI